MEGDKRKPNQWKNVVHPLFLLPAVKVTLLSDFSGYAHRIAEVAVRHPDAALTLIQGGLLSRHLLPFHLRSIILNMKLCNLNRLEDISWGIYTTIFFCVLYIIKNFKVNILTFSFLLKNRPSDDLMPFFFWAAAAAATAAAEVMSRGRPVTVFLWRLSWLLWREDRGDGGVCVCPCLNTLHSTF